MRNRQIWQLILLAAVLLSGETSVADKLSRWEAARQEAARSSKPILLEFYRSDCEHCQQAATELQGNPELKTALARVIYLPVNVLIDEGPELAKRYKIGDTFPVFILTDSAGEPITRWTGYPSAASFLSYFNRGLAEPITIKARLDRYELKPNYGEALYLARFFAEIGEHLEAIRFYHAAQAFNQSPAIDYSFEIFRNTANAVWKDMAAYETVYAAADSVLRSRKTSKNDRIQVATIMSRLARKFGRTDSLNYYLQEGINAAGDDSAQQQSKINLIAERYLQLRADTSGAIKLRKTAMGQGWENDPNKFYTFAQWCLERKINLEEAENLTPRAAQVAVDGPFKGRVYATLAEICHERGNLQGAIGAIVLAIEQHPENKYYEEQLEKYRREMQ